MAKSTVRAAVFAIFNKHLPMRAERGNTAFRKEVIGEVMATFDCTLSSASTYYNTAFKQAKLETARFYYARILPRTLAHAASIESGAEPLMAMDAARFGE